MKRRTFVRSALATAATASMPVEQLLAVWGQKPTKIPGDINAVTGNGDEKVIEKAVVQELANSLRGRLLLPSSEGYDQARKVWNGMIDKHPALIVQCEGPADVIQAVQLAHDYDLLTAVRGGGHNVAGKAVCEGGIMIDLSQMNGIRVDPKARIAWAEPGVLLGALDHETQLYGLATPAGVVSHTGAAGLTLGGGFGRLSRVYGLTCDNVRSYDIVTASGEFKRARVSENPDLYWGLRGGGGNFGVVTGFEYQLHPVGTEFLAGSIMHPMSAARDVFTFFAEVESKAPNELQISSNAIVLPNGKGFVSMGVFYNGDMATGEKLIQPLRDFGKPMNVSIGPEKYVDIQQRTDSRTPPGKRYYQKAGFFDEIQPGLIDAILEIASNPNPFQMTLIFSQVGGAIKDVPNDATAYANRSAQQQMVLGGSWPNEHDQEDEYIGMMRAGWEKIAPFSKGVYTNNMMGDEGNKKVISNYGENYKRLVALKNEYDPTNLFRLNVNVAPSV